MAKLFLRNAYEFENPSRRIFLAGEIFEGSGAQSKKINKWVDAKGESSPEARELAEQVAKQREEIINTSKKELLELYVNLFTTGPIANKEAFNASPFTVDSSYAKNGLLQTLEKNSSDLRLAFKGTEDLRLLAYATVYSNFKEQGLDANYLPIGADVKLVDGYVTVTYTENGVVKTATSELFPWSSYEIAHQKYADLIHAEAVVAGAEAERRGLPGVDLDGDGTIDTAPTSGREPGSTPEVVSPVVPDVPTPPVAPIAPVAVEAVDERSAYEKGLDARVDAFIDKHGLTDKDDRIGVQLTPDQEIGTYNATLKKPDGELVTINVRAVVPEGTPQEGLEQALEKALEEELVRLDKTLGREETKEADEEAETALEKDWQRVWESVQRMVAADERLTGKVTVKEGPRNARGDDKTILVTNTEGETLRYMVGVKERKNPTSYGPIEGGEEDARRAIDAKAIRITFLTLGPNSKAIGTRVSKYNQLADYTSSSVEKGAYNAALIMAGFDPIEEPDSPTLMEVIFKGHEKGPDKPDREPRVRPEKPERTSLKPNEYPLARIDQVPDLLEVYPQRIQEPVDNITDNPPFFGKVKQVGPNLLVDPDAGLATYYVQLETNDGQQVTVSVHPDQITDAQVNAYIRVNGGSLPEGVTHDDVKQYLAYNQLENQLAKELVKAETQLQRIIDKMPAPVAAPEAVPATVEIDHEKLLSTAADALSIGYAWTPEVVRDSTTYALMNANTSVKALADAYPTYLQITSTKIVAPAADGSAEWTATLTTADGETIVVHASALPVDPAVVDTFVQEKAALGLTYSKADVIRHAAYRNVGDAFATAIETAKTENKLGEKYDKFKKRLARTEPVAAVAPTETPTPTPAPRVTSDQPKPGEIDFDLDDGYEDAPAALDAPEDYKSLTEQDLKNQFSGKGTWDWEEGGLSTSYKGEWVMGVPSGKGELILDDDGVVPLDLKDGRFTVGETSYTWEPEFKRIVKLEL